MGETQNVFEVGSDWVYYRTYGTYEAAEEDMIKLVRRDKCEAKIIENKDTFTVACRRDNGQV